jgi:pyridoxal phosphate enzyme (YggS family)
MGQIENNLKTVRQRIAKVATAVGRNSADVTLIAVSKKQPDERIDEMLAAGHRVYGENRVQEAMARWAHRRVKYGDLRLHLIGPLQTNKVKDAVALFDVIQSVDREKLARALAAEMQKQGKNCRIFIQVNTGDEEQKSGVSPADLSALVSICRDEGLDIAGLMCIPPENDPPGVHFAFLKKMAEEHGLRELSMGMSGDYEKAIPLGATYVRVGTALFGTRQMHGQET